MLLQPVAAVVVGAYLGVGSCVGWFGTDCLPVGGVRATGPVVVVY